MRHVPTLARRELGQYLFSPMAYLVLTAFQVIAWLNFYQLVQWISQPQFTFSGVSDPMSTYVAASPAFWIALMVAVPALTMRLIAEERRSGTIETLLTVPVTEAEVVVAKWLAGLGMYLLLLVPFALYLPFLYYQGEYRFDVGPLASLGVGLTTLGMMFVAIGLFFSALTRNQIVAAISGFAALFLLVLLPPAVYAFAVQQRRPWADAVRFTALLSQVQDFSVGLLDLRYLALHLSAAVLMLYLTVKVLEVRRGR